MQIETINENEIYQSGASGNEQAEDEVEEDNADVNAEEGEAQITSSADDNY